MKRVNQLGGHVFAPPPGGDKMNAYECGANTPRSQRRSNAIRFSPFECNGETESAICACPGPAVNSNSAAGSISASSQNGYGANASASAPAASSQPAMQASAAPAAASASAPAAAGVLANAAPVSNLLWPPFKSDYDWKKLHADLENGNYSGVYGWDNAAYWGIAEKKAGVDLREWYKRRTKDEYFLPQFKELIDDPETQKEWSDIFMFDPAGFYAHPPTIAACKANLDIAELCDLPRDGKIIREDGQVRTQKCAIYYTWNIPRLSERLDMEEDDLRDALFKYSNNPDLKDPNKKAFIPGVGGCTIYTFGDVRKIRDPTTEICVRVHDECIGSDVFGSDICTCRPYLIFALEQCIMCAQRGGVGIVIYYRKEGRSLGEVIKFRVYNARENQTGGDTAEKYFHQTENIAGIRDARFQAMMPDALKWMGIKRIDWLCSMSNEKYEAIVGAGIKVMQRVTLPEDYVKENMKVEITAKVASGYNTESMDAMQISNECLTLAHVRKQASRVFALAEKGNLDHFVLDMSKFGPTVDFVEKVITDHYPPGKPIPPHSRMRHLENLPQFQLFVKNMECDALERVRRLLDLTFVSVLVDAGAGSAWKYMSEGKIITSSEGLAVASIDMFCDGLFSSDKALPCRVNSLALKALTQRDMEKGFQISASNPIQSIQGRLALLNKLGDALEQKPEFFGKELPRPGNIIDYLLAKANGDKTKISLSDLWKAVAQGIEPIWPKHASGIQTGDIWHYSKLNTPGMPGSDLVSFHKLTQWLLYSVIEVIETALAVPLANPENLMLTPLAEYRNGGLLVDMGLIKLREPKDAEALHSVGSELIVEWRALTVVLIEKIAAELGKKRAGLTLPQVLEGGTWRAGRIIAKELRPDTGAPPIRIRSDGSVF
ncbi:unnamed protein product [Amoebophrya sp. A25]|nr:unnamed protein product [Amoebophrya sp. A25]|eukprot:GSA25T00025395001.1